MPRGIIFWVIMLVWLVLSVSGFMHVGGALIQPATAVVEFILFALLGWQVYGPAIHG